MTGGVGGQWNGELARALPRDAMCTIALDTLMQLAEAHLVHPSRGDVIQLSVPARYGDSNKRGYIGLRFAHDWCGADPHGGPPTVHCSTACWRDALLNSRAGSRIERRKARDTRPPLAPGPGMHARAQQCTLLILISTGVIKPRIDRVHARAMTMPTRQATRAGRCRPSGARRQPPLARGCGRPAAASCAAGPYGPRAAQRR